MKCTKTRGKKGVPHLDPDDPPRRRGNKVRGHGTWDNDRPPVAGVAGRESGQVRLEVIRHADRRTLEDFVLRTTTEGTQLYTDEWAAYNHLPERAAIPQVECESVVRRGFTFLEGWDQIRVTVFGGSSARIGRVRPGGRTGRNPAGGGWIAGGVTSVYGADRRAWPGTTPPRSDGRCAAYWRPGVPGA